MLITGLEERSTSLGAGGCVDSSVQRGGTARTGCEVTRGGDLLDYPNNTVLLDGHRRRTFSRKARLRRYGRWARTALTGVLPMLCAVGSLAAQAEPGPPGAAAAGEEPRLVAGVSAAAVWLSGETWPRVAVWTELRAIPPVSVWGEVWGVRRATVICGAGVTAPRCDETSDAVGWLLGARFSRDLGPGDAWVGMAAGRFRYAPPAGSTRWSRDVHLTMGYRLSLGDRMVVSPRLGFDLYPGGGWHHLGGEAGVRF